MIEGSRNCTPSNARVRANFSVSMGERPRCSIVYWSKPIRAPVTSDAPVVTVPFRFWLRGGDVTPTTIAPLAAARKSFQGKGKRIKAESCSRGAARPVQKNGRLPG